MTSSERSDSPPKAASAAEADVGRDEHGMAALRRENEALKGQLAEAWEQQAATSGILHVISSSPAEIQPVLQALAENAARLCRVENAVILQPREDHLYATAGCGTLPRLP